MPCFEADFELYDIKMFAANATYQLSPPWVRFLFKREIKSPTSFSPADVTVSAKRVYYQRMKLNS